MVGQSTGGNWLFMASLTKHCGRLKAAKTKKQTTTTTGASNTTSNVANTFGQISPLDDPRFADAVGKVGGMQFEHDPRISNAYARERTNLASTYNNPMGGFYSPQLKDAILASKGEDITQRESEALREENQGFQGMKYAQAHDVASFSAPKTVQTGGSSTSTGTSSGNSNAVLKEPFSIDPFIQGGSAMGSALLM